MSGGGGALVLGASSSAVSQLAVWVSTFGLRLGPRLGQLSALGASLGACISASKDDSRCLSSVTCSWDCRPGWLGP